MDSRKAVTQKQASSKAISDIVSYESLLSRGSRDKKNNKTKERRRKQTRTDKVQLENHILTQADKDIVGLTSIEDIGVGITSARDALKKRGRVVHLSHTSPEELKYVKNARTGQEHLNYSLSTLTNAKTILPVTPNSCYRL
jgi:hypothetical protein